MVSINITYETLFDLLRREKNRNELQVLEPDFFEQVQNYLVDKKNSVESEKTTVSRAEKEKIRIQLKNAKKIIKELYEIREKKILQLASNKAKTESSLLNTNNLLETEKEFFKQSYDLIKKYKQDFLMKIEEPESTKKEEGSVSSEKNDSDSSENEYEKIVLKANLPKFVGLDKKIYGPFNKGEETELPNKVANLLIEKGRAEKV